MTVGRMGAAERAAAARRERRTGGCGGRAGRAGRMGRDGHPRGWEAARSGGGSLMAGTGWAGSSWLGRRAQSRAAGLGSCRKDHKPWVGAGYRVDGTGGRRCRT